MAKFKVGDRIRVNDNASDNSFLGRTGTVKKIGWYTSIYLDGDNEDGEEPKVSYAYHEDSLDLLEDDFNNTAIHIWLGA